MRPKSLNSIKEVGLNTEPCRGKLVRSPLQGVKHKNLSKLKGKNHGNFNRSKI
jgi:hypothetical protein